MKKIKQKLAVALLAGALVLPFGGGRAMAIGESVDETLKSEYKTIAEPREVKIEDFIKSLKMISEREKQILIKAENQKKFIYEEMNPLKDKIDDLQTEVLREADPIFDEIFKIKKADEKLWNKLFGATNKNQTKVGNDMIKFIKLSNVLTDSEKKTLTEAQDKIDALYKEVDKYYQKAEKATEKETKEYKKLQDKIIEINKSVENIWDKIYK